MPTRSRASLLAIAIACAACAGSLALAGCPSNGDSSTLEGNATDDAATPTDATSPTRDAYVANPADTSTSDAPADSPSPPLDAATATDAAHAADAMDATTHATITVWNGDSVDGGAGWATPTVNPITIQSAVSHSGNALFWNVIPQTNPWSEWGWNWKAWQTPGTDVSTATTFTFYLKVTGNHPPNDIVVTIRSSIDSKYAHQPPLDGGLRGVSLKKYAANFSDGAWHDVTIPMADLLSDDSAADFRQVYEVYMGAAAADYQVYLDDIAFQSQ